MYNTALVAIDINDPAGASHVVEAAIQLLPSAKFHILNVVPDSGMAIVGSMLGPDHSQRMLQEAKTALDRLGGQNVAIRRSKQVCISSRGQSMTASSRPPRRLTLMRSSSGAHRPELKDYLLGPNAARRRPPRAAIRLCRPLGSFGHWAACAPGKLYMRAREVSWGRSLELLHGAVRYRVHTILSDNGIQFAEQSRNINTVISRPMRFYTICDANGIKHRLTKPNHPSTNGQVERMNGTTKDATVKLRPLRQPRLASQPSR